MFLVIGICAFLFNRAYTHYGSMENPGMMWKWAAFLYNGKFVNVTNICLAMTYLSMGAYFTSSKWQFKTTLCIMLIVLGAVEMHFEMHKDVALGVPVIAFGLFPLVKKWNLNCSWLSFKWLRKMSTLIYFSHVILIVAISQTCLGDIFTVWCIVILCCLLFAALLLGLSEMRGMQWIKKLY